MLRLAPGLLCGGILGIAACTAVQRDREPMGVLPDAVTSAEPLWIPFSIRAGKPHAADPRERRLASLRRLTFDGKTSGVAWHPDGTRLVVASAGGSFGCGRLIEIDLGSGERRAVSPPDGWADSPSYAGEWLIYAFAPTAVAPCPTLLDTLTSPPSGADVVARLGNEVAPLVTGPAFDGQPAMSPLGWLAFSSTRDENGEIYLQRAGEGAPRRLTREPGFDGGAVFSADGSKLAWHRIARNGEGVTAKIVLAGGAGQHPTALSLPPRVSVWPAFLADSRRLLFTSSYDALPEATGAAHFDRGLDLYLVDPEQPPTLSGGASLERVTFHDGLDARARFSPDGRHVAFLSSRGTDDPKGSDVFVAEWRDDPER